MTLLMQALDFAVNPKFKFDIRLNRYVYTSGASKGMFAPKRAILSLTKDYIAAQKQELIDIGSRLSSGSIDLAQFQKDAARSVKQLHLSQAILGRGGVEKMTSADFLAVARTLKEQYYQGIGKDDTRYGLKWLAQDIKDGHVSPAQLANRLRMYGDASQQSYWYGVRESSKDAGKVYAIRKLGSAHEHCQDCLDYAALPPQPIGSVVLPSQSCQCMSSCRCSLVLLTLEEAISKGMNNVA